MSVTSRPPAPVATVGDLQPLAYIALKRLVRRREQPMLLKDLAGLVPLTPVAAEDICRLLLGLGLIEVAPVAKPIGATTQLMATTSGRDFVDTIEGSERNDFERLDEVVRCGLKALGHAASHASTEQAASTLRQVIWQEARRRLGIDAEQPIRVSSQQRQLLRYVEHHDADLYNRLERRAHLEAFWKHFWLNEKLHDQLTGITVISIFLDTNVLIGALVASDRWHEATLPILASLRQLGQQSDRLEVELLLADETLEELHNLLEWTERLVWVLKRLDSHLQEAQSAAESLRRFGLVRHYLMSGSSSFRTYRRHLMSQLQSLIRQCNIGRAPRLDGHGAEISRDLNHLSDMDVSAARHDVTLLHHARHRAPAADPSRHSWCWTYDSRLPDVARKTINTRENVAYGPLLSSIIQWLLLAKADDKLPFSVFKARVERDMNNYFSALAKAEKRSKSDLETSLKSLLAFYAETVQSLPNGPGVLASITEACYRAQESTRAAIGDNTDAPVGQIASKMAAILGLPVDWLAPDGPA